MKTLSWLLSALLLQGAILWPWQSASALPEMSSAHFSRQMEGPVYLPNPTVTSPDAGWMVPGLLLFPTAFLMWMLADLIPAEVKPAWTLLTQGTFLTGSLIWLGASAFNPHGGGVNGFGLLFWGMMSLMAAMSLGESFRQLSQLGPDAEPPLNLGLIQRSDKAFLGLHYALAF